MAKTATRKTTARRPDPRRAVPARSQTVSLGPITPADEGYCLDKRLRHLASCMADLESTSEAVEKRLARVLMPPGTSAGFADAPPPVMTEIGAAIDAQADIAVRVNRRLLALLERLGV